MWQHTVSVLWASEVLRGVLHAFDEMSTELDICHSEAVRCDV